MHPLEIDLLNGPQPLLFSFSHSCRQKTFKQLGVKWTADAVVGYLTWRRWARAPAPPRPGLPAPSPAPPGPRSPRSPAAGWRPAPRSRGPRADWGTWAEMLAEVDIFIPFGRLWEIESPGRGVQKFRSAVKTVVVLPFPLVVKYITLDRKTHKNH